MEKLRDLILDDNVKQESDENVITIRGAKHHNLKNVNLTIPKNKLIVFTGVSGSGKSTIVFDIIHGESQRRFMNGLSTFERRSIGKIEKPKVEVISGLTPSIAIEQKSVSNNPRSTVGTLTEISDYMRLLYSRIGMRRCSKCDTDIKSLLHKNSKNECPNCHEPIKPLLAQHFSSNTPHGMCQNCKGLGVTPQIDLDILIENENASIMDGALKWFGNLRENNKSTWPIGSLDTVYNHYNINIDTPWKDLSEDFKNVILFGSGDEKLNFPTIYGSGSSMKAVKGVASEIERLYFETSSEATRKRYAQYMSFKTCPVCHGNKLSRESLNVKINGKNICDVLNMPIREALEFIKNIYECADESIFNIAKDVIVEIYKRLSFLNNVGLHYLTLNRTAPTLSGGEGQRVRLATALSSQITGITYILDEPSTGLHPKDLKNLISTLKMLRDNGNTVIVVEHDEDIIKCADHIVDIGPYAGVLGGKAVAQGTLDDIKNSNESLTGKYLTGGLQIDEKIENSSNLNDNHRVGDFKSLENEEIYKGSFLSLKGACHNNLKNINVDFPLNKLTCITGVSGSGKSSLISETLEPLLENILNKGNNKVGKYTEITGYENLDKVINVSQEPIGRTPKSNPATYIGLFDKIRKVFAETSYAKEHKMNADYFSFNSEKGRCPYCQGQGQIKIEMHFLPDVWIECDECNGKRFKDEVLANTINGINISDVLEMDVEEALDFFNKYKDIYNMLKVLKDVGLGYIKLGQSSTTLSGGEAQRVKLAKELSKKAKGRTVYIFDEPTNGLHFNDIKQLLNIFRRLLNEGHTLIVIEHNLDIINCADWIVDIGPDGGDEGGQLIVQGTLEKVKSCRQSFTGRFIK